MELELSLLLPLCLVGLAAGFVDSVAGGGGLLTLPAVLLTGLPPDVAIGTNKLAGSLGTGASLLTYARSGLVVWRLALCGLPAALLGGVIGSRVLLLFDSAVIGKIILVLLPF